KAKQTESAGTVTGSALAANVDEVTLLAALIQCEAGNQSYDCQLAVGAVVVNRVKSPSYPNTLVEVIYQKSQFGPASNGALAKRLNKSISETAMAAASAALNGDSNVGGACNFKLTKSGHEGIAIDALVFY
ncbi:MAG: cell wall hydrolase, partial [Lachnospiraceae bacterium]|nr:cell wall hydrolase [Lachnospiraceae bacterium]